MQVSLKILLVGKIDYKMNTTIEIKLEYSLNGDWVWTKTHSQDKDTLYHGHITFDNLKDRKKSLNKFVEKHRWGNESKHQILKRYKVKKGWQFSFLIRDTYGMNVKKWHTFKITSHNFEVNYNKIAEKKNYDLQKDFGLFPWPYECK